MSFDINRSYQILVYVGRNGGHKVIAQSVDDKDHRKIVAAALRLAADTFDPPRKDSWPWTWS